MSDIIEKTNFAVLCDACEFYDYYVEIHTIRSQKMPKVPAKLKIVVFDKNEKPVISKGQTQVGSPTIEYIAQKLLADMEERGLFGDTPDGV